MTLQNVRKIKGAADKNGLKDVICHGCCLWNRVLKRVVRQRTDGDQLAVADLGQLVQV